MFYIADRQNLNAQVQAPFVLGTIRALRSSIFKNTPEVQRALAIAAVVERKHDLSRADLFLPMLETICAIIDPLSGTLLRGVLRRVGNEVFPALISVLGIPPSNVKAAMGIKKEADVVRVLCNYYAQCVTGADAGTLTVMDTRAGVRVTDTTIMPCQMQMGAFVGAGTMTHMFRDSAMVEKRCRAKGDPACVYELTFTYLGV